MKSPFNFVPVSDKVYFPDWADRISQDVPFSDGISGVIHLDITAHTPIFVRNGHTKDDAEDNNAEYKSFSHIANHYFIPATSIKGEVRNLLEILSFSKMNVDHRALFAQREWDNPQIYPIKNIKVQNTIHCGWLRRKGNNYEIKDCGHPLRISHKNIDNYIGQPIMERHFSKASGIDLNKDTDGFDPKSANYKYKLLENIKLKGLHFSKDYSNDNGVSLKKVTIDNNGDLIGTIVLTGQPNNWVWPRKQSGGKFYEFVFEDRNTATFYPLSEDTFKHYKFIYQGTTEWKRIKNNLETDQGVPVFFRVVEKKVKDFGMAYLYKLPYDKTPYETLPIEHRSPKADLAQCIFGHTSSKGSLKGRVQFGYAFSDNAEPDKDVTLILNSPKASYYPIYIRQEGKNGQTAVYHTYNDGTPSGWKRYYPRKQTWQKKMNSEKLDTIIHPVKAGATFHGDITFHNLRPIELGALLSALTYHGTTGCYHSLGQGKPYGFGRTTYKIELDCDAASQEPKDYMAYFEQAMTKTISSWATSEQVTTLLTIAHQPVDDLPAYHYMEMDMEGSNEFLKAKGGKDRPKEYLPPAKQVLAADIHPMSLLARFEAVEQQHKEELIKQITLDFTRRLNALSTLEMQESIQIVKTTIGELSEKRKESDDDTFVNLYTSLRDAWQQKQETLLSAAKTDNERVIFSNGLIAHLATVSSFGNWFDHIKKWKKWAAVFGNGRTELTDEETAQAACRLAELYKESKKSDQKKFNWKKASELLGKEINKDNIMDFLKE